jgi:hypothetical protein
MDWSSLLPLGIIVAFWLAIFVLAVGLARRFLRGVGEPVPEEPETRETSEGHDVASANGNLVGNRQTVATSPSDGGKPTHEGGQP